MGLRYSPKPDSKQKVKDHLLIRVTEKRPMKRSSINQWTSKLRPSLHKFTYHWQKPVRVPIELINTKRKIGDFMIDNYGVGEYTIVGGSHGKTKRHFKWVRLFEVKVVRYGDEEKAIVTPTRRMSRYKWFWKG